jgi:hypothetical protein
VEEYESRASEKTKDAEETMLPRNEDVKKGGRN